MIRQEQIFPDGDLCMGFSVCTEPTFARGHFRGVSWEVKFGHYRDRWCIKEATVYIGGVKTVEIGCTSDLALQSLIASCINAVLHERGVA